MRNVLTICSKEVSAFFNSLVAYIVVIVFLCATGLFFWVFGGNVLISGLATMDDLFSFAPWFFLFLVPAITMRSFAEEFRSGTIEILSSKPVRDWEIIIGKFLAALFLISFSLLPTLFYYFTLAVYGNPPWNLDNGPIIGAYIGLLALGAIFSGMGIFASSLSENQIVSFILALFMSFIFFSGFDFLAEMNALAAVNPLLLKLSLNEHYRNISKGVVDSRDIIYFMSLIVFSLFCTRIALAGRRK